MEIGKDSASVRAQILAVENNIAKVMVGCEDVTRLILTALITGGHVLLEDLPGTGKTTLARTLARSVDGGYQRIQFTPDLLPTDVTGLSVYSQASGDFTFRPGPVFTNILLADEINRATPRTQAGLLECMEEKQVTTDGVTRPLADPFFVIATQNPIETGGTFPLPEAQMDRFLMRLRIGYPTVEEEADVLERYSGQHSPMASVSPVCTAEDILRMQDEVGTVYCSPEVRLYIAQLAAASREHPALQLGVSPRGSIALLRAAQATALLFGRDYVLPDDIRRMAQPVLAHRLVLKPEARMKGASSEQIVQELVSRLPVPVKRRV